jgi:hypothetical protein
MRCARDLGVGLGLALALGLAGCKDAAAGDDEASDDGGTEGTADTDASEAGSDGSTGEPPTEYPSLDERPCPDDSFLTWENFGAMYLYNYCTGCHASGLPADQRQGAPIEVNFDELADVRAWAPKVWARAGDQNATMPPVGAAGGEERALFGEWLACGAPTDEDFGL